MLGKAVGPGFPCALCCSRALEALGLDEVGWRGYGKGLFLRPTQGVSPEECEPHAKAACLLRRHPRGCAKPARPGRGVERVDRFSALSWRWATGSVGYERHESLAQMGSGTWAASDGCITYWKCPGWEEWGLSCRNHHLSSSSCTWGTSCSPRVRSWMERDSHISPRTLICGGGWVWGSRLCVPCGSILAQSRRRVCPAPACMVTEPCTRSRGSRNAQALPSASGSSWRFREVSIVSSVMPL